MLSELRPLQIQNNRMREAADTHAEAAVHALVYRTVEWRTSDGVEYIPVIDGYIRHLDAIDPDPVGREAQRRSWLHELRESLHAAAIGIQTPTFTRASELDLIDDVLVWVRTLPVSALADMEPVDD